MINRIIAEALLGTADALANAGAVNSEEETKPSEVITETIKAGQELKEAFKNKGKEKLSVGGIIKKLGEGSKLSDEDYKILFDEFITNKDPAFAKSILDAYATGVYDHLYVYKDKAKDIDPSIDTNTLNRGATAQELETVDPAVVSTTSEGAKVVDTDKLETTNASAIGELSRKVKEQDKELQEIRRIIYAHSR